MKTTWLLVLAFAVGASAPPLLAIAMPRAAIAADIRKIEIQSFKFAPDTVEIQVGDTVEWVNHDFAPHTATADSEAWTTGLMKKDETGRFIATMPGTFTYHCKFHPQMKATIVVK